MTSELRMARFTLVLAPDGEQGFHWRRGTALSHRSPVTDKKQEAVLRWISPALVRRQKHAENRGCGPRIKLRTPAALSSLSQTEFKKKTCCSPQYQDKFFIHCLAESGKKGKRHKRIHRTKPLSIQNSGYIQKLCPLGEAHSIVSSLQLRVLSQLGAHHGHLLIDVHEKAIFRVLQEERREKFKEWRGEHDAADQSGCRAASPWILRAKYDKVKLLFFCLTQPVPPALQMSYVRWTNLSEPAAERRTRAVAIVSLWFLGKTFGYLHV